MFGSKSDFLLFEGIAARSYELFDNCSVGVLVDAWGYIAAKVRRERESGGDWGTFLCV